MKVYENNKMLLKELIYHIKRSLTQEITKDVIEYDIVIPFHKETLTTLPHVIKSLEKFLSFRVIYVVGPLKYKDHILKKSKNVCFVDGNTVVDSVSKESIESWMTEQGWSSKNSGWLFQQIIKMGMCRHPGISDYYLCWDADTYLLNPIRFFSDNKKQLVTQRKSFGGRTTYYKAVKKLFNIEKRVNFSYIKPFMIFDKNIMNEMLEYIENNKKYSGNWAHKITKVSGSDCCWSEFEAYGIFLDKYYSEKVCYIPCNSSYKWSIFLCLNANSLFNKVPNKLNLFFLSLMYDTASFEDRHRSSCLKKHLIGTLSLIITCVCLPFYLKWKRINLSSQK